MKGAVSRREWLLSLPLLSAATRARAQESQSPPTFSVDVKVVNVFATVRDKRGQIVRDLTANDFILDEDGQTQSIKYFSRQSDLPLVLGLLVDISGSQRSLIETERHASRQFLHQVLREDKDQAFLIHFDREVELLQDLTSSRQLLEKALEALDSAPPRDPPRPGQGGRGRGGVRGGTSLYDAILLAGDELMRKQTGRKALILLTDGVDMGSKVPIDEAIDSAQRADTFLYSIRFYDPQANGGFAPRRGGGRRGGMGRFPFQRGGMNRLDGKKILQRLSEETGGGYFEVSAKHPLDAIYAQIEEELRSQYSIGYTSSKPATGVEFRKIKLAVKKKGLVVQTREGYYAGKS